MNGALLRIGIIYVLIVGAILVFREIYYGGSVHGPAAETGSIWYKAD